MKKLLCIIMIFVLCIPIGVYASTKSSQDDLKSSTMDLYASYLDSYNSLRQLASQYEMNVYLFMLGQNWNMPPDCEYTADAPKGAYSVQSASSYLGLDYSSVQSKFNGYKNVLNTPDYNPADLDMYTLSDTELYLMSDTTFSYYYDVDNGYLIQYLNVSSTSYGKSNCMYVVWNSKGVVVVGAKTN